MSTEDVRRDFSESLDGQGSRVAEGTDYPRLPKEVWTGIYELVLDCFRPTTEAAEEFHYAMTDVLLGMIAGRDTYLTFYKGLRLNSFAAVLGPTADAHKSEPLRNLTTLLDSIGLGFHRIGNLASIEGLHELLVGGAIQPALIHEYEMAIMTHNAARAATRNILAGLCYVYDCPERWGITKVGGKIAEKPYVSLLGASTPDWANQLSELNAITSGFLNRVDTYFGDSDRIIAFPPEPEPERLSKLVNHLTTISKWCREGFRPLEADAEARERFESWYTDWKLRRRGMKEIERELTARTDVRAWKGAGKRALSRTSPIVTLSDLEPALTAAETGAAIRLRLFQHAKLSNEGKLERLVMERHPGGAIKFSELHERVGGRYSAKQVLDACNTLKSVALLAVESKAHKGRRNTLWVSKPI